MSQRSKLIASRKNWKEKAMTRADEARYLRRENNRIKKERNGLKQQIKNLEKKIRNSKS